MKDKFLLFAKYFIIFTSLGFLICPPIVSRLFLSIIISAVISVYASSAATAGCRNGIVHKELIVFDTAAVILLGGLFYCRWINSSKLAFLADKTGLSTSVLLICLFILICIAAVFAVDRIMFSMNHLLNKNPFVQLLFVILLIAYVQYLQLVYSSLRSFEFIFAGSPIQVLVSICILAAFQYLIGVLILPKTGLYITAAAVTAWSIANYYVIEFHGSPLYLSELSNMRTAMAVAGGYHFEVTVCIVFTLIFGILEAAAVKFAEDYTSFRKKVMSYLITVGMTVVSVFGTGYHLKNAGAGWSWQDNIRNYGFIMSAAKDIAVRSQMISRPDSYDPDHLEYDEPESTAATGKNPDIIVILNETFCDLSYYSDVKADRDYLEAFRSVPDSVTGTAIVPGAGGGTNRSEFELLTSKSMNLLPDSAPFLYLDQEIAGRSVIEYLKKLGYHTTAMHCGAASNYSRNVIYPAMGFDEIYLGEEMFNHFSKNGERRWLDSDNYQDLIECYEDNNNGTPQVIYLLTMQNHGGWEQNDDSLDTVHILNDYGDLTDDLNEYLSSVALSSEAFLELTEYYAGSEREVIIFMAGDHSPSFIDRLNRNDQNTEIPKEIAERAVPYIIWANYGIDIDHYTRYASLTDLVPMILEQAGIPLSAFYTTLLKLHDMYPIRFRNGYTMDSLGNESMYDSENDTYNIIRNYYNLEYNSLMKDTEYREELFMPE